MGGRPAWWRRPSEIGRRRGGRVAKGRWVQRRRCLHDSILALLASSRWPRFQHPARSITTTYDTDPHAPSSSPPACHAMQTRRAEPKGDARYRRDRDRGAALHLSAGWDAVPSCEFAVDRDGAGGDLTHGAGLQPDPLGYGRGKGAGPGVLGCSAQPSRFMAGDTPLRGLRDFCPEGRLNGRWRPRPCRLHGRGAVCTMRPPFWRWSHYEQRPDAAR